MQSSLLASPPSMSLSVYISETQVPVFKILKTLLNEFEDDDQHLGLIHFTPVSNNCRTGVQVDELFTYMSLRIRPETRESEMNLAH